MATRWWCLRALTRRATAAAASHPLSQHLVSRSLNRIAPTLHCVPRSLAPTWRAQWPDARHFSSKTSDNDDETEDEDEDVDEDDVEETSEDENLDPEAEAAAIGYKVVGSLEESERVFKPYEPVFAVVQVGSHQFKVSNGDTIYVERLKHCDVNDKLILNKVLLLGSSTQTIVGRPILPEAAVHAVVEEHALDAKVIIFKKKRRKNYRRTKGHRQELTRLRIADIQGIEKPENKPSEKPLKVTSKKPEKVAVAA